MLRLATTTIPFALAALALIAWFLRPGGYFRPIEFSGDKVDRHLPTDRPKRLKFLILVPEVEFDHLYFPDFDIEVDPIGHPVSGKLIPSDDRANVRSWGMTESAVPQIRGWTFVPFPAHGHPIYARFPAAFTL